MGGGAQKVLPCLGWTGGGGGAAKSFGPTIFPFCSPPVIYDRSQNNIIASHDPVSESAMIWVDHAWDTDSNFTV